jgi:3-methyladenine DNA glycosylase AlkD
MRLKEVVAELRSMGDPESVAGLARYGITSERALGVSIPKLQALAWPQRSEEFVKRNLSLNRKAIAVAEEVQLLESRAARWVARNALRELRSEKVQRRLIQKAGR